MTGQVSLTVIGSINLDLVAKGAILPAPGQTVTDAFYAEYPGGKGANQALAAKRLGADVRLIGRTGDDSNADAALSLLTLEGVNIEDCKRLNTHPTGVALIAVSADGENQIIVAPGANNQLAPADVPLITSEATLSVLEVPIPTIQHAAEQSTGLFAINLAPALPVPDDLIRKSDLIIVNEGEAEFYGDQLNLCDGIVAITYGADGAAIFKSGEKVASAEPPTITVADTTGAGDTFCAALVIALCRGMSETAALQFSCAAGALTATRHGAQPSFPTGEELAELNH
ncbi:MAG: ribokinase [Pseudomonadota bacterium]